MRSARDLQVAKGVKYWSLPCAAACGFVPCLSCLLLSSCFHAACLQHASLGSNFEAGTVILSNVSLIDFLYLSNDGTNLCCIAQLCCAKGALT